MKMQLLSRMILIISLAILVSESLVGGEMPLTGTNNSTTLFSGQIPSMALSLKPEPPATYEIGMNVGKDLFSGQILIVSLNPQPEPPLPYVIGENNSRSLFSGQIQTVTINPPPKPLGILNRTQILG